MLVLRVTKEVERDLIYFKLDSKFKHILIDDVSRYLSHTVFNT